MSTDVLAEWSIDQLAAATGVPSRTIRLYQTEGVLPRPERRGRVAVYDQRHVERLRLIAELQDRGLRLSAIRDLVRRPDVADVSVGTWLGLGDAMARPWTDEQPEVLSAAELDAVLAGRPAGARAALVRAGLLTRDGGGYRVPNPTLLGVALRLDAAGVDIDTAAGAAVILRKRLHTAAEEVVHYFASRIRRGVRRGDDPEAVVASLDALRTLGLEAVRAIYAEEVDRAVSEAISGARPSRHRRPR